MASINMDSIMSKATAYSKSKEGKAKIAECIERYRISSTDNGDSSYKITVTPRGEAEIDAAKFIDTFRINNNNSAVKSAATEVTATDNKGLTFKFTPANANK